MKIEKKVYKKLFICFFAAFVLASFSFFLYTVLTGGISFSSLEDAWDGESIAYAFPAGNGTEENPYLIQNASEFIYFKTLIEGDQYKSYQDKYYALDADLDFGNHSISGIGTVSLEDEKIFMGHLDGRGHTISKLKIDQAVVMDDVSYYGLFTKTKDATIENLNISSLVIEPDESSKPILIGTLAVDVLSSDIELEEDEGKYFSEFHNIVIDNFLIDIHNIESKDNMISSLIHTASVNSYIHNLSCFGTIRGNKNNQIIGIINGDIKGKVSDIISNITLEDNDEVNFVNKNIEKQYIVEGDKIYHNSELVSMESLLFELNDNNNDYYWDYIDDKFIVKAYEKTEQSTVANEEENISTDSNVSSKEFSFSVRGASAFTLHDSGISGNTFYINDLDSDLNYYNGLNYTSSGTNTPTMENKNLYTNSNLVQFEIIYHGNTDSRRTGTISYESGENQNTIIYYKYYPVSGNSIDIELIDNPFSGRPYDMAFNGWYSEDSGITIYLDQTYYVWHAIVPMNGESQKVVELYASWVEATMARTRTGTGYYSSSSIQTALGDLNSKGMELANTSEQRSRTLNIVGSDRYYYTRLTLYRGQSQAGYYNARAQALSGNCNSNSCTVYQRRTAGEDYNSSLTYYYNSGNNMYTVDPRPVEYYRVVTDLYTGMNMAGYYERITLGSGQSQEGMLDADGNTLSGNCSRSCTVYRKIPYLDSNSNPNIVNENNDYYYLVTRDTNIVVMNDDVTSTWSTAKPFTLTSYYNGDDMRDEAAFDIRYTYIRARDDTRIEYIQLYSSEDGSTSSGYLSSSDSSSGYIYGNHQNLKIGRGITDRGGNYRSAIGITGSVNSGGGWSSNSYSNTKYKLIVESGRYTYAAIMNIRASNVTYNNPKIITVFGNDYDRILNENDDLDVYKTLYGDMAATATCSPVSNNGHSIFIKSGRIGSSTDNTDNTLGIYATSNYSNVFSCEASVTVEGGVVNNIYGGPGPTSSMRDYNSVHIYFKGGEADTIFGGGAYLTSYGNRILQVTGGKVNYSVVGGSNGYRGDEDQGSSYIATLNGDSYVYVGGSVEIGFKSDKKFEMEAGSVFGVANGKEGSTSIGSVDNSYVVINGGTIHNNVYGGGNFGATALSKNSGTYETKIKVLNGTIDHSVYAGGNNNGAGTTGATVNSLIDVSGGTIKGSVYGGSKTKGTVYGGSTVNVSGGTINTDVYGGGEGGYSSATDFGTYVRDNIAVTVSSGTIKGNVYGGSAYGTVNAINQTTNTSNATTTVTVTGGVIQNSVFGGGKGSSTSTPKVVGDITVNINGGSIGKVFGGFDASGKPSNNDIVYLNSGTVGDAFGGGNNANQDATDIRLQGSTITGNLYGGSNLLGTVTVSKVTVDSGSVTDVYGGNNMDGLTVTTNVTVAGGNITGDIYGGGNEASSGTSNVLVAGYTDAAQDVYGGGKKAGVTTTNVNIMNDTLRYVFGGSNVSGTVGTSNVHINNSTVTSGYGGNNQGGQTNTTNIDTKNSTLTNLFGGGDNAISGVSNVTVYNGTITNVYGGGNEAGLTTSNVTVANGTVTNVFGGSNESGNLSQSNVLIGSNNPLDLQINYTKRAPGDYPNSNKPTYAEIEVTVNNLTSSVIEDWEISLNVPNSTIFSNYSQSNINVSGNTYTVDSTNRYYGKNRLSANGSYTFSFAVLSDTPLANFNVTGVVNSPVGAEYSTANIQNVYGGNNQGGVTSSTNIDALAGTVHTIYGGGNEATVGSTHVVCDGVTAVDVYGGGNAAGVTGNTVLDIDSGTISNNVYGGGNEGIVGGNSNVFITDAHILGNAFGGGNGSTAVVHGNSTITIDGTTEIGTTTSAAPNGGCVFGSGNAASTGVQGVDTSVATVNIVGGIIHGNVYGGPKMAVVYGTTDTNIGTSAVSISGLKEDDIVISGTVFGGGESNASGSETYDWTFISVTEGIDVLIDGTGYINNNHSFIMNGSVFGSGNASSSSGTSNITIKNLGSRDYPNKSISVQRADNLIIDHSVIELVGTTDRTNEYSDIYYSFNMIDKLIIKNDTVLLLQHNANMLKELYSGVDVNGSLTTAVVDIDEENESVTKNVDNRIYMLPGQNLNVTINQAATAYGRVTGMTFFGMYNAYDGGTYRYGLYADDLDYGDSGNAGLEIVGGSYVMGLRNVNHDITKDGFYSNYLNDDYTEIVVNYIDPSPIGETGYRWIVGFEAINYEFTLNASKYSSLGTYELQLIDFAEGNTIFNVIGLDTSGLNSDIQLVDSNNVPRVARTEADANSIFGLSMKAETQEWTGYGTTKMLGNDTITGDREYITDSRQLAPSLMFYLYHAKNINCEGNLGTAVLTLRADVPTSAIDYDITFVTVTINIVARKYDDADSYDASITYDKRYDMPSATLVNITNQSQFSAYYSLIAWNDNFSDVYGINNRNYHTLVTNNPLPVNTMITMLDYGARSDRPEYYYFRVTQSVYNDSVQQLSQYNEVTYPLHNFIKMDSTSTNNKYDDSVANHLYYDDDAGLVDEEFVFIFDFKETTTTGDHLDNTMLFELRNHEDRTVFSVLGIREGLMFYNTYESSNVILNQTFTGVDEYLYYNIADEFDYSTRIQYDQTDNRQSVIDTNYESSSMGLNVAIYDHEDVQVSSSMLIGTSITIDNREYFADGDGVFRIKLAKKVSNLDKTPRLMVNKDLPPGEYKIRYTLFASDDGLHNSVFENSVYRDFTVHVVSASNSIVVDCDDHFKIVDGDTGLNMNNTAINIYRVKYNAQLNNPNFRVEVFKRNTNVATTTAYTSVPFSSLFSNNLSVVPGRNEVYINMGQDTDKNFSFNLRQQLTSGTYRIVFKLYDNDQLIDEEAKYVIVSKKTE